MQRENEKKTHTPAYEKEYNIHTKEKYNCNNCVHTKKKIYTDRRKKTVAYIRTKNTCKRKKNQPAYEKKVNRQTNKKTNVHTKNGQLTDETKIHPQTKKKKTNIQMKKEIRPHTAKKANRQTKHKYTYARTTKLHTDVQKTKTKALTYERNCICRQNKKKKTQ